MKKLLYLLLLFAVPAHAQEPKFVPVAKGLRIVNVTPRDGHLIAAVESDAITQVSYMTIAGIDAAAGNVPVALKVAADGTLVTGADPGGAPQECYTCIVVNGVYGAVTTPLKVGSDGTVATSGGAACAQVSGCGPLNGNNAWTGNESHSGTETFTGLLQCKNVESMRCVDDSNSQGWSPGSDIGAWVNDAVAALPVTGGSVYISAPNGTTQTTTIADGGTKVVHFLLGAANIVSNVTAFHLTTGTAATGASSITGSGNASVIQAGGSMPASSALVLLDNGASGVYGNTVRGLSLVNNRNSRVGLIRVNYGVSTHISDILTSGLLANNFFTIGVESLNGFLEDIHDIHCTFAHGGICVGVSAPDSNTSDINVHDIDAYDMTGVATNYTEDANNPTLLDTTTIGNVIVNGNSGQAKEGVTTVSGSVSSGVTTFPVASGAACFMGYGAWIGDTYGAEYNYVVNISSNNLTLLFPTLQAYTNGQRVLCGNPGIHLGLNSIDTLVNGTHVQDSLPGIDVQDAKFVTIVNPVLGIITGGPLGDGIRLDAALFANIFSPNLNGFANAIEITSRAPAWGSTYGVQVYGYFNGSTNTNEGIHNDSGQSPIHFLNTLYNAYGSTPGQQGLTVSNASNNFSGLLASTPTAYRTWTMPDANGTLPVTLTATTASIGGSALTLGACASGTATVTGAAVGMAVAAQPQTYPGAGFDWSRSYVSAAGTVVVQVCADVAGTPASSLYKVYVTAGP